VEVGGLIGKPGAQLGKLQTLENMTPGGHRVLLGGLALILVTNTRYSTTKKTPTKLKATQGRSRSVIVSVRKVPNEPAILAPI
jgi:hypothetical protein